MKLSYRALMKCAVLIGFVQTNMASATPLSYGMDLTALDHAKGHYFEVGTTLKIANLTGEDLSLVFDPAVAVPRVRISIPDGVEPFVKTLAAGETFSYEPPLAGSYRFGLLWESGLAKGGELAVVNPATVDILIVGVTYVPNQITIQAGQTVRWINTTGSSHTVTADSALANDANNVLLPAGAEPFHSGELLPGETFTKTFDVVGDYGYFCVPHERMGHLGSIVVE